MRRIVTTLILQHLKIGPHHLPINISLLNPRILDIRVTFPVDQELTRSPYFAMIKDGFDRILFVVDINGRWIQRNSAGEQLRVIVMSEFQASSVDLGVNPKFRR